MLGVGLSARRWSNASAIFLISAVSGLCHRINQYIFNAVYTPQWAIGSMSLRCKTITWHISPLLPCYSVSPLIQEEILINYTTTDSCFCLLLGMSDSVISLTDKRTVQFSKQFPPNRNQPSPSSHLSWILITLSFASQASGQKCKAVWWQLCWSKPFLSHLVLWGKRKCLFLIKWWILEQDWLSFKPLEEYSRVYMSIYVHMALFVSQRGKEGTTQTPEEKYHVLQNTILQEEKYI